MAEDFVLGKSVEERIHAIYCAYLNTIAPFILQIETRNAEFPVELLNEIRSILTF